MFRLDKRKIFLLYQYYLLNEVEENEEKITLSWLQNCLAKKDYLQEKITENLKENWELSSLPPLEKAILIFASYELIFGSNAHYPKIIIDQVINFSKVYLEENKFKYINKNLDLLWKNLEVLS
jgi:transcription termination factor NusB